MNWAWAFGAARILTRMLAERIESSFGWSRAGRLSRRTRGIPEKPTISRPSQEAGAFGPRKSSWSSVTRFSGNQAAVLKLMWPGFLPATVWANLARIG